MIISLKWNSWFDNAIFCWNKVNNDLGKANLKNRSRNDSSPCQDVPYPLSKENFEGHRNPGTPKPSLILGKISTGAWFRGKRKNRWETGFYPRRPRLGVESDCRSDLASIRKALDATWTTLESSSWNRTRTQTKAVQYGNRSWWPRGTNLSGRMEERVAHPRGLHHPTDQQCQKKSSTTSHGGLAGLGCQSSGNKQHDKTFAKMKKKKNQESVGSSRWCGCRWPINDVLIGCRPPHDSLLLIVDSWRIPHARPPMIIR